MRTSDLYLLDILDRADDITSYLAHISAQDFTSNEVLSRAVLMNLIVIGEAASHVDHETRAGAADIPWRKIIGFRNVAVHGYFELDMAQVFQISQQDLPVLRQNIAELLGRKNPKLLQEYDQRKR